MLSLLAVSHGWRCDQDAIHIRCGADAVLGDGLSAHQGRRAGRRRPHSSRQSLGASAGACHSLSTMCLTTCTVTAVARPSSASRCPTPPRPEGAAPRFSFARMSASHARTVARSTADHSINHHHGRQRQRQQKRYEKSGFAILEIPLQPIERARRFKAGMACRYTM